MEATHRYDLGLKQLFLHPEMIQSLIQGFISQPWTKELDFASLQPLNAKHVTQDLRSRENDIIWKIRAQGQWLYLIFILEFQSSIDKFMAVRLLTYCGLIYQDLLKSKTKLNKSKSLPPVLSLVFYTGDHPWSAPLDLKECLNTNIPEALMKFQPQMQYLLLDVGRINLSKCTLPSDSLMLSLIELEKARNIAETTAAIKRAAKNLNGKVDRLKRAFHIYVTRVLKLPEKFPTSEIERLCEGDMLYERHQRWIKEEKEQGKREGIREGIREGEQQGLRRAISHVWDKLFSSSLPQAIQNKLDTASCEELEQILDKILEKKCNVEELI